MDEVMDEAVVEPGEEQLPEAMAEDSSVPPTSAAPECAIADQVSSAMDLDAHLVAKDAGAGEEVEAGEGEVKEAAAEEEYAAVEDEGVARGEESLVSVGQGSPVRSKAIADVELHPLPQSPPREKNEPLGAVDCSETVATAGPEITLEVVLPHSPLAVEEDTEMHPAHTEIKQPDDGTPQMEGTQQFATSGEVRSSSPLPDSGVDLGAAGAKSENTELTQLQDASEHGDVAPSEDGVQVQEPREGTTSVVSEDGGYQHDGSTVERDASGVEYPANAQDDVQDHVLHAASDLPAASPSPQKTELQREMELYEAAEREQDEMQQRLASARSDLRKEAESQGSGEYLLADVRNDKKRPCDSPGTTRKGKRGRKSQSTDQAIAKETAREEEDVCFMCFDGGDLVLCDRRTCPKAYHLDCIGRDRKFFEKKGAWICGWHYCCVCTKAASFQCYTCPTGYCPTCRKDVDFLCISKRKGLCSECRPIVNMIEKGVSINSDGVAVDFNDRETSEYLFKEYWRDLKQRLEITLPEFDEHGKVVEGGVTAVNGASESESGNDDDDDGDDDGDDGDASDSEKGQDDEELEEAGSDVPMRRTRGKSKTEDARTQDADYEVAEEEEADADKPVTRQFDGWASKELIDFVKSMDQDSQKPLNNFAVNKLLWIHIKQHKLQDPREKTLIYCDEKLQALFGQKQVRQVEIFRLLMEHYPPKPKRARSARRLAAITTSIPPAVTGDVLAELESTPDDKSGKTKEKRKLKKKDFDRPDTKAYAAVSRKNIELIYLKRALLEFLLDDPDFSTKAVSAFVRIRVPGMTSKTEMCYRLVQIIGTKSQPEVYKAGRKMTDVVLEILNLQKKEEVTVDLVSNQDFTEEECQRLRQSIKCGFIKAPTVGELEEKAMALQAAKFNDWFETEQARLTSLRDRASETGRKKELRECVEKLKELNNPSFRAAKLLARPEVAADPRMDPAYESDSDNKHNSDPDTWDKSPSRGKDKDAYDNADDSHALKGDRDSFRSKHSSQEKKSRSKDDHAERSSSKVSFGQTKVYGGESDGRADREKKRSTWDKDLWRNQRDQPRERSGGSSWKGTERSGPSSDRWLEKSEITSSSQYNRADPRVSYSDPAVTEERGDFPCKRETLLAASSLMAAVPNLVGVPPAAQVTVAAGDALEKERVWHYRDPQGNLQGPFSMEQLRKWNTTGLFPVDLRIWKSSQDDAILLIDALAGSSLRQVRDVRSSIPQVNPLADYGVQLQGGSQFALGGTTAAVNGGGMSNRLVESWPENGGATTWGGREGADTVGRVASWGAGIGGDRVARPARVDWDGAGTRVDPSFQPRLKTEGGLWSPTEPENMQKEVEAWPQTNRMVGNGAWSSKGVESVPRSPLRSSGGWGSPRDGGSGRPSWRTHDDDRRDSSRVSRASSYATREARKETPCKFFKNGYCKRGDTCHFMH